MSSATTDPRERPWRRLIMAIIVFMLILLALALWSQRDDSLRLPEEDLESTEVTSP